MCQQRGWEPIMASSRAPFTATYLIFAAVVDSPGFLLLLVGAGRCVRGRVSIGGVSGTWNLSLLRGSPWWIEDWNNNKSLFTQRNLRCYVNHGLVGFCLVFVFFMFYDLCLYLVNKCHFISMFFVFYGLVLILLRRMVGSP